MGHISPEELRSRLGEAGLSDLAEDLISHSRDAVAVFGRPGTDDDRAIAASKLGGLPDLAPGTTWPTRDGRPLAFLLQINLADVPAVPSEPTLPSSGLLSFYFDYDEQPWGFDPADRSAVVVLYQTECEKLVRTAAPDGAFANKLDEGDPFNPHSCDFEVVKSYIDPEEMPWTDEQFDRALDEISDFEEEHAEERGPRHQLLGHASGRQNVMREECQLASNGVYCGGSEYEDPKRAATLAQHASDWTLLLQLDTDENIGWVWGDMGRLFFWIRKQDLAVGDFSNVWFVLQCG